MLPLYFEAMLRERAHLDERAAAPAHPCATEESVVEAIEDTWTEVDELLDPGEWWKRGETYDVYGIDPLDQDDPADWWKHPGRDDMNL